jgi:hypothetical protein
LRLELTCAVTRDINLHLAALAAHRLWSRAVARVAGVIAGSVMLLVAEMVSEFAVEGALD